MKIIYLATITTYNTSDLNQRAYNKLKYYSDSGRLTQNNRQMLKYCVSGGAVSALMGEQIVILF